MNERPRRIRWVELSAVRIALIYAVVSVMWILGSDHLALLLSGNDPLRLAQLQQSKGLFFVLSSSVLIFVLVNDHHRRFLRTQRQLAARERELQHAQKMEAVGVLAGGVAHDFNNLLQVIGGRTQLLLDVRRLDDEQRAGLEQIAAAGQRAAGLVGQLLTFSRRQVLQPEDLDLNALVATVLQLLERTLGPHLRIEFLPGRNLGTVRGDRNQLEQLLLNLCLNARDAMPEGGVVTVVTENVRLDADYCRDHPWATAGDHVRLRVIDQGCGMDTATLARIWEPFFTTKEAGKGTGLGLSTVYGIVQQHGGFLHVESEPGQGSSFQVYLPRIAAGAPVTAAAPA
jgi:two-component system, cell cycle sensor histidine kinase and response regulator CckA